MGRYASKVASTDNLSVRFDGQCVFFAMEQLPQWTFESLKNAIALEGGYIDEIGFIHKGICVNNLYDPYN